MEQTNWEEEFDKKFGYDTKIIADKNGYAVVFDKEDNNPTSSEQLKNFISSLLKSERDKYKNEAGEAMAALVKIIDFKHIGEDEKRYASILIENYNRQNEVNYVRSLQEKISEQYTAGYKAGREESEEKLEQARAYITGLEEELERSPKIKK